MMSGIMNKMPRYRRDHRAVRAMRPIYECPENNVSAKSADDCARISTLQSYHLFGGEIIFKVFQPMWSGYLNVTDVRDGLRRTIHCGITAR